MSKLVIMESPSKAKTVKKYLGSDYEVIASVGHIRDLPKSLLGVDVEHGFTPRYVDIPGKSALIRQLKEAAARSERIFLATDPDREGEAIAWHLALLLGMPLTQENRVTFNEITRTAVTAGIQVPRQLDMNLVNAQQARRVLDRIVGYKLSPFLWKKVRKGLSAGRVQSATVSLVVDRENEIRAFVSEEYWTLDATLSVTEKGRTFPAKFYGTATSKIKIKNKEQADAILEELKTASYQATTVKTGTRRVAPAPPFTTSTMQQEANRRLNFSSRRTMKTAQELYEGVEVAGVGATGLITYMRTDSLRISEEARRAGNDYIRHTFGDGYLPPKARYYKSKSNAQDAHEAIRPSVPSLTPEQVKNSLTGDQYKLYKLIWERFMASLMADQIQNTCQVDISAGKYLFKASGYTVEFDGHAALYVEEKDEKSDENKPLPVIHQGDTLFCRKIGGNQHFTQPPARYNEATLIKAMEESGIGRPSTYAATVSTILSREYVERDGKAIKPTLLGEVVTGLMKEQFPEVVDLEFTAHMEEQLDGVEHGKDDWVHVLEQFYGGFSETLAKAEKDMEKVKVPEVETDEVCELCGRRMVIKTGRYGKFLACPGYPTCKNTKRIVETAEGECPKCGGQLVSKKSRGGRKFYGCVNYPKCDFATWNDPTKETCPKCGKTLFRKKGKNGGIVCLTEGCGYEK
ncbi:MAG: type I DNA topoisomerase [Ruminococcaceae bacterium]|nr:type I DNA topoisomerase [Oscillospiraceae bacterium]